MHVRLIVSTPAPLRLLWTAARTCRSDMPAASVWRHKPDVREQQALVLHVLKQGHLSIAEHVQLTYGVHNISRACLAQLSRHRIGVSMSVRSQRMTEAMAGSVLDGMRLPEYALQHVHDAMHVYKRLRQDGVSREDARLVLPEAMYTSLLLTVNLRSLHHLWTERAENRAAQDEIRVLVRSMVALYVSEQPWVREWMDPGA